MQKLFYLPCFAVLAAAAPVSSSRPPVTTQIASVDAQQVQNAPRAGESATRTLAPEDKKICKQLPSSSSRLPNRACLTAKEWKQVEDDLSH